MSKVNRIISAIKARPKLSGGFVLVLLLVIIYQFVVVATGPRIIFLGDSITQAGSEPGGYVSIIRDVMSKDNGWLRADVVASGVNGNRVRHLQQRIDRDVIAKSPDMVVVYIGVNDAWDSYNDIGASKEDFAAGIKDVIKRLKAAGTNVILCTPTVIGEHIDGINMMDPSLDVYADIIRMIAKEEQVPLLDLRRHFVDYLQEYNVDNLPHGVLTKDTIHLNKAGHEFVALHMLRILGVNP